MILISPLYIPNVSKSSRRSCSHSNTLDSRSAHQTRTFLYGVKRLRARWSIEASMDLEAYHSMSSEHQLANFISQEIAQEIDRAIMWDLNNR